MYTLKNSIFLRTTPKVQPYSQYELIDHSTGTRKIIQGESVYYDENVAVVKGRLGLILVFDIKTKNLKTDDRAVTQNNNEYRLYIPEKCADLSVEGYEKSLTAFYKELAAQGLTEKEVQDAKNNDVINNALVLIYSELLNIPKL